MSIESFWKAYKETNSGWRGLTPFEAYTIGWLARNKELDAMYSQLLELIEHRRRIEKENIFLRLKCARLQVSQEDLNGED